MKTSHLTSKRRIIGSLCLIFFIAIGCKSFALENDLVYYAIVGGMYNGCEALDQALIATFEEQQSQDAQDAEEERQRLKDLGYPDGYDPDDPVAMGEVDPYAAMQPDIDEIMMQQAMDAWEEYNHPKEDISDHIIKP